MPIGLFSAPAASVATGCQQLKPSSLTSSFFFGLLMRRIMKIIGCFFDSFIILFISSVCSVLRWYFTLRTNTREHLWKLWRSRDASMNSRRWNNRPKGALEETERQGRRRWLASRRVSGYVWKHCWMLSFLVSQVKVLAGTAWQTLRAQHWCIFRLINPPPPSHPRLRLTQCTENPESTTTCSSRPKPSAISTVG